MGKIIFKIVAIVAFSGAVGLAISSMGKGSQVFMAVTVALGMIVVINFILIPWLLKLDLTEAPLIIAAVTVFQSLVMFIVAQAVGPKLAGVVMFGMG
jgi:hypothetical protein